MIYSILQIVPIMELCSSLDLFNLLCVSLTVRKLIKKKMFSFISRFFFACVETIKILEHLRAFTRIWTVTFV
jgi:hypothetical protein